MTRFRLRVLPLGFAAAALCLLSVAPAPGQGGGTDLKPYRMDAKGPTGATLDNLPGDLIIKMGDLKSGKLRTRGTDEKANKELFRQIAQFYVYKVTHDNYYTVSETGELKAKLADQSINGLLDELESRFILVPPTAAGERLTNDQMEYIQDFGAALDAAVVAVLNNKTPPAIIRLNAARMLAVAAKTGAPVHGKTILALLTNAFFKKDGKATDTPPEVLYHTLRAAEAFFAAQDPRQIGTPRAGYHWLMFRNDDQADLLALVRTLETMALNGPAVLDKAYVPPANPALKPIADQTADPAAPPPKTEPKGPAPEQLAVMKYFRREAVRALAKVRFDTLPIAAEPANQIRPVFAVAKIAVADGSINPAVTVAESLEAVIGLCGVLPSQNLNVELVIEAVGRGVRASYAFQGRPESEKIIPWKVYSARLKLALEGWKTNAANNPRLRPSLAQITALANLITTDILDPIDKDQKANLQRLDAFVSEIGQRDPNRSLYKNDPQTKLNPRDVVAR